MFSSAGVLTGRRSSYDVMIIIIIVIVIVIVMIIIMINIMIITMMMIMILIIIITRRSTLLIFLSAIRPVPIALKKSPKSAQNVAKILLK